MTAKEAVMEYSDMLYRICIVILGNEADAQDAVQDTFLKYLSRAEGFKDKEYEKAWLIRVATNRCRDMLRFSLRHPVVSIEEVTTGYGKQASAGYFAGDGLHPGEVGASSIANRKIFTGKDLGVASEDSMSEVHGEIFAELLKLPIPEKTVIYLHYIEGYKIKEIAEMMRISVNAVKKRLQRGREMLRLRTGEKGRSEKAGEPAEQEKIFRLKPCEGKG